MDFKALVQSDLGKTFLNDTEFATNVSFVGGRSVPAVFDEAYEVIENDEIVAVAPALIVKNGDAKSMQDDDRVEVGGSVYYVADKLPETDITVVLLRR